MELISKEGTHAVVHQECFVKWTQGQYTRTQSLPMLKI